MRTRARLTGIALALTLLSLASTSSAEERVTLEERVHFGVATAPFEVRTLPEAKGQAFSFVTDGRLHIGDFGWVGLRIPVVAGSVAQPAGSYVDEAAWGNPEARAAGRTALVEREDLVLRLTAGGGIGAPLAESASSLLPNRALAIANAVEGFSEPELFRPGRLPLTPFAELDATSGRWRVIGSLKVPILFRVSDADLPSAESESRAVGIAVVAGIEGRVSMTRVVGFALAAQSVVGALPAAVHVRDVSPVQFLFRGGPFFQITSWGIIALDVQAPIGGALGGSTVGGGLRLGVSL